VRQAERPSGWVARLFRQPTPKQAPVKGFGAFPRQRRSFARSMPARLSSAGGGAESG